jgi:hypothetical protein
MLEHFHYASLLSVIFAPDGSSYRSEADEARLSDVDPRLDLGDFALQYGRCLRSSRERPGAELLRCAKRGRRYGS